MADWDSAKLILYGEDGPAFVRQCPRCARFMRWPDKISWQERWDGICEFPKIECSKCGLVEPDHVGWAGDFR